MTYPSELSHKIEVEIHGVPAPRICQIINEALKLYYEKYEDEFDEIEHEEMIEVFWAFTIPLSQIDYSIIDGIDTEQ